MIGPGRRNLITDVDGLRVGHATDAAAGTGVTVLVCPGDGWTASVDIRGGGPAVRETQTLDPENLVGRAHAITLSGGSVYGLAAADGAVIALAGLGVGLRLKAGTPPIPIVPAACLHDLAGPGDKDWGDDPPYRALGVAATLAAAEDFALGSVGAGTGAQAGQVKGGIGSASIDLGGGLVVGALIAANPVGSVFMPDGTTYWAWPFEIGEEFGGRTPSGPGGALDPMPDETKMGGRLMAGANTSLGVVAVTARLTSAECKRFAMMAQDGLARAIRPAHTPFDGDLVFGLASGVVEIGEGPMRAVQLARLGSAAADCLARAVARAVYEA
ncbi:MAG: peptidase DmpA [Caulobacteraceae bacterium]|nr:peptidase DmpA [Caulobacteraceae bacterium]